MTRIETALGKIDAANRLDPREQTFQGVSHPRERIFAQRVSDWIDRLQPASSEEVRLAARAHTLNRWEIPRNRFPMDTMGYHAWRAATANHSAGAATAILKTVGYSDEVVEKVRRLITRELDPKDPEAQMLEDADCLAFLEIKLGDYLDQWDEAKVKRILRGTWSKMSPEAHRLASDLPVPPHITKMLEGF